MLITDGRRSSLTRSLAYGTDARLGKDVPGVLRVLSRLALKSQEVGAGRPHDTGPVSAPDPLQQMVVGAANRPPLINGSTSISYSAVVLSIGRSVGAPGRGEPVAAAARPRIRQRGVPVVRKTPRA